MWTEEELEKAAEEYKYKVYEKNDDMCDEVSYDDIKDAFLAGVEYINKRINDYIIEHLKQLHFMKVKFKKLNENAVMPKKAHKDDFCYDLVATSCEEVAPNVWKYGTGLALQIEDRDIAAAHFWGKVSGFTIRPRSSVWKTGMVLSNGLGTVDEGYTGEISAVFYHVMPDMPKYEIGDRICQLHFDDTLQLDFEEVDELTSTDRGTGGYGSTGK